MHDKNGYIPDVIDNNGNIIPADIFFSKEIGEYLRPFITSELDQQILNKLKWGRKPVRAKTEHKYEYEKEIYYD